MEHFLCVDVTHLGDAEDADPLRLAGQPLIVAEMTPRPGLPRSLFALVDGLLLFLALEGAFYAVAFLALHRSFDTPTPLYLTCNLLWTLLAAGLAGYTAARVAHRSPVLHGVLLAVPLLLLAAFNLQKGLGGQRTGFVLAINLLSPAACIFGAWLAPSRRPKRPRG